MLIIDVVSFYFSLKDKGSKLAAYASAMLDASVCWKVLTTCISVFASEALVLECTPSVPTSKKLVTHLMSMTNYSCWVNYCLSGSHLLQDITWLKSITNLPILIKGVLTPEDGKLKTPLLISCIPIDMCILKHQNEHVLHNFPTSICPSRCFWCNHHCHLYNVIARD